MYPNVDAVDFEKAIWLVFAAFFIGIVVVAYEWRWQRQMAREMTAVIFGLALGLAASFILILFLIPLCMTDFTGRDLNFSSSFTLAFTRLQPIIPMIVIACAYIGITIVLQTRNDFRFLIPYIDFSSKGTQEGGMLLDSSAIIDGRIADIIEAKIIMTPVVIPDFVIKELQTLADSSDKMKRQRGRRGLDIAAKMQKSDFCRVTIRPTDISESRAVDEELARCAKEINARIVTTDFNLNKVCQIEGIHVINVNDLANALKPAVIPGEKLTLKVLKQGQEYSQGVGYLDDGTMVVVENGREHIGTTIHCVVTGAYQTSAGRMIFVRPTEETESIR